MATADGAPGVGMSCGRSESAGDSSPLALPQSSRVFSRQRRRNRGETPQIHELREASWSARSVSCRFGRGTSAHRKRPFAPAALGIPADRALLRSSAAIPNPTRTPIPLPPKRPHPPSRGPSHRISHPQHGSEAVKNSGRRGRRVAMVNNVGLTRVLHFSVPHVGRKTDARCREQANAGDIPQYRQASRPGTRTNQSGRARRMQQPQFRRGAHESERGFRSRKGCCASGASKTSSPRVCWHHQTMPSTQRPTRES